MCIWGYYVCDEMPKKKKVNLNDLKKSGWIIETGKKGDKKKKVQTTFLDIKEDE